MIIKQLYVARMNSTWSNEDEILALTVFLSLLCAVGTGLTVFNLLDIFGPWVSGHSAPKLLGWISVGLQQLYFWGRFARYANLRNMGRMKNTGEIVKLKKTSAEKKDDQERHKLEERKLALSFADELKKFTGGKMRI